jgi:hypothetical protein
MLKKLYRIWNKEEVHNNDPFSTLWRNGRGRGHRGFVSVASSLFVSRDDIVSTKHINASQ